VEGLGVRTAPDDLQDAGQGNVIVGDVTFKRPARITSICIALQQVLASRIDQKT